MNKEKFNELAQMYLLDELSEEAENQMEDTSNIF